VDLSAAVPTERAFVGVVLLTLPVASSRKRGPAPVARKDGLAHRHQIVGPAGKRSRQRLLRPRCALGTADRARPPSITNGATHTRCSTTQTICFPAFGPTD
jgi:hypothetical protein